MYVYSPKSHENTFMLLVKQNCKNYLLNQTCYNIAGILKYLEAYVLYKIENLRTSKIAEIFEYTMTSLETFVLIPN